MPPPLAHAGDASLHGARFDWLVGACAAYLLAIPFLAIPGLEGPAMSYALALASTFVNSSHYGATLMRVYERAEDRRRYRVFSSYATVAIALLFLVALNWPRLGAVLVTLYISWSPWHFGGQNFGLSLTLLRRGGAHVDPFARRLLWFAFLFPALAAFAVSQSAGVSVIFAPTGGAAEDSYDVLRAGLPLAYGRAGVWLFSVAALGCGIAALLRLRGLGARGAQLGPVACLIASQWLWFALPALPRAYGRDSIPVFATAAFSSLAHSAQYLWIASYYAARERPDFDYRRYFARALYAGVSLSTLPGLLVASIAFTDLPWSKGLAMLSFACANLHHFLLDGAIWKLRDGRIARILLRGDTEGANSDPSAAPPARGRGLALRAAGLCSLAITLVSLLCISAINSSDLTRVELSARVLRWVQRDDPYLLGTLGDLYTGSGRLDEAEATYRRALSIRDADELRNNLAWLLAVERGDAENAKAAFELLLPIVRVKSDEPAYLDTLAAASQALGRQEQALSLARAALALAQKQGDAALASAIEIHLADFSAGRKAQRGVLPSSSQLHAPVH
jgi:tetratricopeptide (TPR) repeat protein